MVMLESCVYEVKMGTSSTHGCVAGPFESCSDGWYDDSVGLQSEESPDKSLSNDWYAGSIWWPFKESADGSTTSSLSGCIATSWEGGGGFNEG